MNTKADMNIKVVCRLRGLNALEMSEGGQSCIESYDRNNVTISVTNNHHAFSRLLRSTILLSIAYLGPIVSKSSSTRKSPNPS